MSKAKQYAMSFAAAQEKTPKGFITPKRGFDSLARTTSFWVDECGRLEFTSKHCGLFEAGEALDLRDWLTATFDDPGSQPAAVIELVKQAKHLIAIIGDRLLHGDDNHRAWLAGELGLLLEPLHRAVSLFDGQ